MNKFCKVNCLDIKIEYNIIVLDLKAQIPRQSAAFILDRNSMQKRIYLTYSPEITKLGFFSTLGGLIGLWLGLSIYEFLLKFTLLFKILIFQFVTQRFEIFQKIFQKMELCLKFLLISILIMNLKLLVNDFILGKKLTKINIIEEVDLPQLKIANRFNKLKVPCQSLF